MPHIPLNFSRGFVTTIKGGIYEKGSPKPISILTFQFSYPTEKDDYRYQNLFFRIKAKIKDKVCIITYMC